MIPCTMSSFAANPFSYLMQVGEKEEEGKRRSQDGATVTDLQVRMMMWELEAYMDGAYLDQDKMNEVVNDIGELVNDTGGMMKNNSSTFSDFIRERKPACDYFKRHSATKLKLDRMCHELQQASSVKVMQRLRERVRTAEPAIKQKKLADTFGALVADALEEQRSRGSNGNDSKMKMDLRELNRKSSEYVTNKLSSAMTNVTSLMNKHSAGHSGTVTPVLEFVNGVDDDDDDDHDDSRNDLHFRSQRVPAPTNSKASMEDFHPFEILHDDDYSSLAGRTIQNGGRVTFNKQKQKKHSTFTPCSLAFVNETKGSQQQHSSYQLGRVSNINNSASATNGRNLRTKLGESYNIPANSNRKGERESELKSRRQCDDAGDTEYDDICIGVANM